MRCRSIVLALIVTSPAHADVIAFDESASGDASDDRFAPTLVELVAGRNSIRGTLGISPTPDTFDLDYITITVPAGYQLSAFVLDDAFVGGAFSFLAIQSGPVVTIPADWSSIDTPLLGWTHFGIAQIGQDLLAEIGSAPGSVGFSGPLPAGTYALWLMELNYSEPYTYAFGLDVTAVPAPSPLLVALAASLAGRRRLHR